MSRGGCFACVVPSPAPSPCDRLSRLRLLWAGLTPGRARSCLPCVEQVRPRHRSPHALARRPGLPSSRCRPPSGRSSVRFSSNMPRSWIDPGGTVDARLGASSGAGFPILLLDLLPHLYIYGAVSTFGRLRAVLWPAGFPVYASPMLFPHPDLAPSRGWLPVFEVLVTRRPSAVFNGLANINATLGSYYWLGFVTSGLAPDKKRLALLGAQRSRAGNPTSGGER